MGNQPANLHDNHRLSLTYEPIDTVKINPRDPRKYGVAETRRVAKAIKAFGPIPLIVNAGLVVISGNIWLEAAKRAGVCDVPIIVADHLTNAQAEAFMVAVVRLVERGVWDDTKLGEILRDLSVQDLDFDLDITGFDVAEIDLCIEALDSPIDGPDPADELAPDGPAVSREGDCWLLRNHRLLNGDARAAEAYDTLMADEAAAIVVSDPPYNVKIAGNVSGLGAVKHGEFVMASGGMTEAEFTAFLMSVLNLAAKYSQEGSLAYWFMDWRHINDLIVAGRPAYGSLKNLCVWVKTNAGMGAFYRSQHELICVFKKGKGPHRNNIMLGKYGRNRTNVWTYPGANTFGRGGDEGDLLSLHPTVKPVALIADMLLDASKRGDLVLDPFMGSGSTLIAAEKVGRRAYGIEIDPAYVDTAVRRWERWTGEEARLASTGRTFAEMAAERAREGTDV